MNIPQELRYTKTHEWVRKEGNKAVVGISDYAQKEISDVVFVETPKVGQNAEAGKPLAVVESVKAAFDIYAPVSGQVTKVNTQLEGGPGVVNAECYGEGWFFEIEMTDTAAWDQLMSAEEYEKVLKAEAH